jgi:ferrochelatase
MNQDYDAVLIVSFGGPEGPADVMPFLRNVVSGRNVSEERLRVVSAQYELFGGVSPINRRNRELIRALTTQLETYGPDLPVYWGNRNWHPMLVDTIRQMADDGITNALAFFTSAYSSYSGCRQYIENIESARSEVGPRAPRVSKLRAYYNHPGFVEANTENVARALESFSLSTRSDVQIVFTAHSIPTSMAASCEYEAQLLEVSSLIAASLEHENWKLVFQSRSGPPSQPWLEPDILAHLRALPAVGTKNVVIAPIGFVSDHMEVVYDLDTQARCVCEELEINMVRAATVGTHPKFISMIRELILERTNRVADVRSLGSSGARTNDCAPDCCPSNQSWHRLQSVEAST